jgi:hypothetical protein
VQLCGGEAQAAILKAMGEAEGRQGARRRGRGGGPGRGPALPQLERPPLPGPESLQLLLRLPAAGAEAAPDGPAARAAAAAAGAGAAGLPEAQRAHAERLARLLEALASGEAAAGASLGASDRLVAAAAALVHAGALSAEPALLSDAPWPLVLSGEAVAAWAALPSALRRVVLYSLAELASGRRAAPPFPRPLAFPWAPCLSSAGSRRALSLYTPTQERARAPARAQAVRWGGDQGAPAAAGRVGARPRRLAGAGRAARGHPPLQARDGADAAPLCAAPRQALPAARPGPAPLSATAAASAALAPRNPRPCSGPPAAPTPRSSPPSSPPCTNANARSATVLGSLTLVYEVLIDDAPEAHAAQWGAGAAEADAEAADAGAGLAPRHLCEQLCVWDVLVAAPPAPPQDGDVLRRVAESRRRALDALEARPLVPLGADEPPGGDERHHGPQPRFFAPAPAAAAGDAAAAAAAPAGAAPGRHELEIRQRPLAAAGCAGAGASATALLHCPPPSGRKDYSLLRRYKAGEALASAALGGWLAGDAELPFRATAEERRAVALALAPRPMVLRGRSGTGKVRRSGAVTEEGGRAAGAGREAGPSSPSARVRAAFGPSAPGPHARPRAGLTACARCLARTSAPQTTCMTLALYLEWAAHRAACADAASSGAAAPPPLRQLFVTASQTLLSQVEAGFRRLQWPALTPDERRLRSAAAAAGRGDASGAGDAPVSLVGLPEGAWPLFVSGRRLLRLLDDAREGAGRGPPACPLAAPAPAPLALPPRRTPGARPSSLTPHAALFLNHGAHPPPNPTPLASAEPFLRPGDGVDADDGGDTDLLRWLQARAPAGSPRVRSAGRGVASCPGGVAAGQAARIAWAGASPFAPQPFWRPLPRAAPLPPTGCGRRWRTPRGGRGRGAPGRRPSRQRRSTARDGPRPTPRAPGRGRRPRHAVARPVRVPGVAQADDPGRQGAAGQRPAAQPHPGVSGDHVIPEGAWGQHSVCV